MAGLYAPDGFANGTIASCSWLEESLISQTLDRSREQSFPGHEAPRFLAVAVLGSPRSTHAGLSDGLPLRNMWL